ncbi:hypothetical protein DFH09DRAFT_1115680 [Mycena vulgaris]|nr:hypothetical protein DFH09DRAFT_1115680 [Mycena vulgaris]
MPATASKARRSRKTLPNLPRSPFDRGMSRCAMVPRAAEPIGVECAPQDLFGGRPLGLFYDLAYQFCDSSRDCTGLMTDELCERGWREQMPIFATYCAQDCDNQFGYQPHDRNGLTTVLIKFVFSLVLAPDDEASLV